MARRTSTRSGRRTARSLYFLSDRQGITNIYRIPVDGGEPMQLTNILTGVSGITSLSPALSAGNGRIVFSAYEDDGYNIYALDGDRVIAETQPIQLPIDAGVLPPRRTGERSVSTRRLPTMRPACRQSPRPKRSHTNRSSRSTYAGQPTIGVGTDPFGTYASGGVSFLFSDTLGNHVIATSAQVTNRLDEFGGSVFYLNRTHRWNWGIGIDQTPYISRRITAPALMSSTDSQSTSSVSSGSSRSIAASPACSRIRSAPHTGWSSPAACVS